MPPELGRFYTLYDGDKRLPRARTDGFIPTQLEPGSNDNKTVNPYCTMAFPKGALKAWENIEDVELIIRPIPWTMQILPLESVDEDRLIAKTSLQSIYVLRALSKGSGNSAWICIARGTV